MAKESFQASWWRWIDEATEDLIKFVGYLVAIPSRPTGINGHFYDR